MAIVTKPLVLDETVKEFNQNLTGILNNMTKAEEKANEAATSADLSTTKAEEASASATTAQTTANALTEFLNTKQTLTAPVVDKTLSIIGAAADASVCGVVKDDVVSLDETILHRSTNLFDRSNSIVGYWIDTSGAITHDGDTRYAVSDYFRIEPNTGYAENGIQIIAYYDSNKNFIRRTDLNNNGKVFTSIENAYYCRFGYQTKLDPCWIKGSAIPAYSEYEKYINEELLIKWLNPLRETTEDLKEIAIKYEKLEANYIRGVLNRNGTIGNNVYGIRLRDITFFKKGTVFNVTGEYDIYRAKYSNAESSASFIEGTFAKVNGNTYVVDEDCYLMFGIEHTDHSEFVDVSEKSNIEILTPITLDERVTTLEEGSPFNKKDKVYFAPITYEYYKGQQGNYESDILNRNTTYEIAINKFRQLASAYPQYITEEDLGVSSDGVNHIYAFSLEPNTLNYASSKLPKVIITAGQHGFEKASIYGLYYFLKDLCENWDKNKTLEYIRFHVCLKVMPICNPYGFNNNVYFNANGINLNRNYDTSRFPADPSAKPWESQYGGIVPFSEPETQYIRDFVMNNTDAYALADFHTNGQYSVTNYVSVNWFDFPAVKDKFRVKLLELACSHVENITAHFNQDYKLNTNEMCGRITNGEAGYGADYPAVDAWSNNYNIMGHTIEGFTGFPNRAAFSTEALKANSELIGNWLGYILSYAYSVK